MLKFNWKSLHPDPGNYNWRVGYALAALSS